MAAGRLIMVAFVGGVGVLHLLPRLPAASWLVYAGAALLFLTVAISRVACRVKGVATCTPVRVSAYVGVAFLAGLAYGSWWAQLRLADALDLANEDKVTRVVLRVAELPRLGADSRSFVADVLSSVPAGVPSRIQVRWNAPKYPGPYGARAGSTPHAFPDIVPGQVWRMALILRRPHGSRNPHGFDYEGHVFAQGIRATGTVRGTPVLLDDHPWASLPVVAQRARHHVRVAMLPYIGELRWGGVLLALAIGDQASVAADDWLTFNRSGLTHLVSISGSHVTMIAVIAGIAMNYLWRRLRIGGRPAAERFPAQLAAAWVALLVAWLYCLLAGWGVPARRTFVMLAIVALSLALRLPLTATHVLAFAAVVVVLLDPWSLLASGFWLSFLAVFVLMASTGWWGTRLTADAQRRVDETSGRLPFGRLRGVSRKLVSTLHEATRLQLLVTLALFPPLALLFNEVSLVSPLANAYAIPVLGALVTPLALLLAGLALVPHLEWAAGMVAAIAHFLLDACMLPTKWLADLPGASITVPAVPWWMTGLAMLGVGVALLPRGFPYRHMGWTFMLPALLWSPARPAPGDWELHALDIGQGSALVLLTARQVLVFDTGVRYSPDSDAAARSLLPFLRARGIRQLDVLVISHSDLDHVGGLRSVLEGMPVEQTYASFDVEAWLQREGRMLGGRDLPPMPRALSHCSYGSHWRSDGVSFEFLWPTGDKSIGLNAGTQERNRNACVLRVRGEHHSVLLPGDIGADEEVQLVERGLGPIDVVVAAHHGSRHSSAEPFVSATQASHAIAQAGQWNRYGHPAPATRSRWLAQGTQFLDTAGAGAILARSEGGRLVVEAERVKRPRYWSTPACTGCEDAR